MATTTNLELVISAKDEATAKIRSVGLSVDNLSKAGTAMSAAFEKAGARFSTEFGLIQKAAKYAMVGVIGLAAGIVSFGISSVKEFAKAEASQNRFETALKKVTGASDEQIESLRKQQKALQLTTRFDDDAIASAQAFLATFQASSKQIEDLTPRLLDMAEGLRDVNGQTIGLEQASSMLGKAIQKGSLAMLEKSGVTIPETSEKMRDLWRRNFELATIQERVTIIGKLLESNFRDQAEAAGKTLAGKLDILNHMWGELKETVGGALNEALQPTFNAITDWIKSEGFTKFLKDVTKKIKEWVDSIGGSDGIKQKFIELRDYIMNKAIPTIFEIIEKIKNLTKFIYENKDSIIQAIIIWEAFKISMAISDIILGVAKAFSILSGASGIAGATGALSGLALALPIFAGILAGIQIYRAVSEFNKLQDELKKDKEWLDKNAKSIEELKLKIGSLKTDAANEQLRNAIKVSEDADKSLRDLGKRYEGLGGIVMAVGDQFYTWGEKAYKAIEKVMKKMDEAAKNSDKKGGNSFQKMWNFLTTPMKALGGAVSSGQSYIVGEHRPEVFVPSQSGNIKQVSDMGGREVNINFNNVSVRNDNDLDSIVRAVRNAINKEQEFYKLGAI